MLQAVNFNPGDTVKVHQKIKEGEKTRIQIFKGIVLGIKGRGESKMFTVMKMVGKIGVERIFPLNSPVVAKVEVVEERKKSNRAKFHFLKDIKK